MKIQLSLMSNFFLISHTHTMTHKHDLNLPFSFIAFVPDDRAKASYVPGLITIPLMSLWNLWTYSVKFLAEINNNQSINQLSIIMCNCLEVNELAIVPYQPMTRDRVPLTIHYIGQNANAQRLQSSLMSLQVGCKK